MPLRSNHAAISVTTPWHSLSRWRAIAIPVMVFACGNALAGFTVFEGAGSTPASITSVRDDFRSAIGGGALAGPNGNFGNLRREINWDGVPDAFSAPNLMPANFFNTNSPRGAVFSSTDGTGFMLSANAGLVPPTSTLFGFPGDFQAFSTQRLFALVGGRTTDIHFFVPGTSTVATTSAFGAIFVDLEDNTDQVFTKMEFFDLGNNLIFSRNGLVAGNQGLTFLGGLANAGERIASVRITTSDNFILANGVRANETTDIVVMDDFIYASPAAVPEPEIWAMVLLGLGVVGWSSRQRS